MSTATLHTDWPLTAPLLAVAPLHDVEQEATPAYDEALATPWGANYLRYLTGAYWLTGPGRQPVKWRPGLQTTCPRCGRGGIAMRRDGGPVKHKFDGEWCK